MALDRKVRIGFVGAGGHSTGSLYPSLNLALRPADSLREEPVGELVAVCDLDRAKAERNARAFGFQKAYDDHTKMLEQEELDCVFVVMHPKFQYPLAKEVMEAGKHVFVEKPPTVTLEQARDLEGTSKHTGKLCMVGFMKRFSEVYQQLKTWAAMPEFGQLSAYEARFTYSNYPTDVYDFLNGFSCHHLDLLRFFMGDVESVFAEHVTRGKGWHSYAVVLKFANDAVGLLHTNSLEQYNCPSERVCVTGVGSVAVADGWQDAVCYLPGQAQPLRWSPNTPKTAALYNAALKGFVGELRQFIESVKSGSMPQSNISDGVECLRIESAIKRSVERGARVDIAEV